MQTSYLSLKSNKKKFIFGFTLLAVLSALVLKREMVQQWIYDINNENSYVAKQRQIDQIVGSFDKKPFALLPYRFKKATKMDLAQYQNLVGDQSFYILRKKDLYKRIVGNIRIKDLISKDLPYSSLHYFSEDTLYWGIDKRILYKLLALQDLLSQKGYDRDALYIGHGHRSPLYNEQIHAAPRSRHIAGEAVDITIGDVNKDGRYTDKDKQIVIDLCERFIIKNAGGLGLYPGTKVVHMDVRGYRARWNSF